MSAIPKDIPTPLNRQGPLNKLHLEFSESLKRGDLGIFRRLKKGEQRNLTP